MKIAALSPHFVIETSPGAEKVESERKARELRHLKIAEPEAASATDPSEDSLDSETREGLKRLTRLLRDHSKKDSKKDAKKSKDDALKNKKYRAIAAYLSASSVCTSEDDKGLSINRLY